MDIKEKMNAFFQVIGMPKTEFCKRIGISQSALYAWQKGTLKLGEATLQRIGDFLARYDSILQTEGNK